jgi:hypothetical protein
MFHKVRERLGSAGLAVAIVALIVALSGGAYAATATNSAKKPKGLTKAQVIALIKANVKPGPPGSPGPAGPAGPAGGAGTKGDQGIQGTKGDPGAKGDTGTGIKLTPIAVGAGGCSGRGGTTVEENAPPNAKKDICTGEKGAQGDKGDPGDPWSVGGVLPPGESETGAWAFTAADDDTEIAVPISFTIPLPGEPTEGEFEADDVHYQGDGDFATACPGASAGEPKAPPGKLCVFYNPFGGAPVNATFTRISKLNIFEEPGVSNSGAVVQFAFSGAAGELARGFGSWAVTAAVPPPAP